MKRRSALAVRPYADPLRKRVFGLLSGLGIEMQAPAELGDGTTNAQAVRYVADHRPDVLVVPFHVVRGPAGERTSGLELLLALRREHPSFSDVPVVMPVSIFAHVAFEAAWRQAMPACVFVLFEHELDRAETRLALRRFLYEATLAERGAGPPAEG